MLVGLFAAGDPAGRLMSAPFGGRSLDDADDWLRNWTAQASTRAEAAQRMSEGVAALTSTATLADGAIKATVAGSGLLTGLELDDRVQRMPGRELAAQIMRAVAQAQAGLNTKVAAVVSDTVGAESETGRAVMTSFERRFPEPPPPEEQQQGAEGRRD
jgi:DNA-binding protein YbaB